MLMSISGGALLVDELEDVHYPPLRHLLAGLVSALAICLGSGAGHVTDALEDSR